MSGQRGLQSLAPASEHEQGARDSSLEAREFRYGWISARSAMAHLGVNSTSAFYRLIELHELPYGRLGRHYRFRRQDLDQWAQRRDGAAALREVS